MQPTQVKLEDASEQGNNGSLGENKTQEILSIWLRESLSILSRTVLPRVLIMITLSLIILKLKIWEVIIIKNTAFPLIFGKVSRMRGESHISDIEM